MHFKQFYLDCLAHASYLIGSEGEAAVVDPRRDVDLYVREAEKHGFAIRYVIETHLHADFVSGHLELAERTGASIVCSPRAGAAFPHIAATEETRMVIGSLELRVLETPGHTPESICLLVTDRSEPDRAARLLTGDTLFIGDVGRPDLAAAKGFTAVQMAGMLYDSLHGKILTLDDDVEVWPAHGAGSLCGRSLSEERSSAIGKQRRYNHALQPMTKEEFVQMMSSDLPPAPAYFSRDAEMNRSGGVNLDRIPPPEALDPARFVGIVQKGWTVLDVRPSEAFCAGHVPGAVNVSLDGQFASWCAQLLGFESPIGIVAADEAGVREAVMRLARVGVETVKGYLAGGMEAWRAAGLEVAAIRSISVEDLRALLSSPQPPRILDVRRRPEFDNGRIPGAVNIALSPDLASNRDAIPEGTLAVICAGGYRSSAASSLLRRAGFRDLMNVEGGTSAWIEAGYPVECPVQSGAD